LKLLFFDFGSGEIFLIVLVIFVVFGPERIPEMARKFGRFINEIKRASEDIKDEINREADKKERERKLQEFRERIKNEEQVSKALPRKVDHVEPIKGFEQDEMQTGEGRPAGMESDAETETEAEKEKDNDNKDTTNKPVK